MDLRLKAHIQLVALGRDTEIPVMKVGQETSGMDKRPRMFSWSMSTVRDRVSSKVPGIICEVHLSQVTSYALSPQFVGVFFRSIRDVKSADSECLPLVLQSMHPRLSRSTTKLVQPRSN